MEKVFGNLNISSMSSKGLILKFLLSYDTIEIIACLENLIAICLNILGELSNMYLEIKIYLSYTNFSYFM